MTKIGNQIFLYFTLLSLIGCNISPVKKHLVKVTSHLNTMKTEFGEDYLKLDLLSHFPDEINDTTNLRLRISPPSCPPSYKCSKQFGFIYLITTNDSVVEKMIKNISIYKTNYQSDSNIIINQTELRRNIFPVEKCNKTLDNKYPIPFFESYNFNLGEKTAKKLIDGIAHVNYIHTIPEDLVVYVINAESGDYWKEKCNESRPETLQDWRNGYSKGIAISKEKDIIVYWTMTW